MGGEGIDVFQVAAVGVVGEEIAAEDQAADFQLADLALGQAGGATGAGRRVSGSGFRLFRRAPLRGQRQADGGQDGFFMNERRVFFDCISFSILGSG